MISLIIPTLNAGKYIGRILDAVLTQTVRPDEIIIVDSESDDDTVSICSKYEIVDIIQIKRSEFDHGGTRDIALRRSKGDIIVFLSHDAVPANERFIENLIAPIKNDSRIAVVSGRHIPRDDATKYEKLIREFNYPSVSNIRDKNDIPVYGLKTFFTSDVCAAYRRDIYLEIGGFEHPLKTNEDMFFAAIAVQKGYKVAYEATAEVIHSHNFTLKQQYRKNYIISYEIQRHHDLLGEVSMDNEGMKLFKYVSVRLLKKGCIFSFIMFGIECCVRMLGSKNGRRAK